MTYSQFKKAARRKIEALLQEIESGERLLGVHDQHLPTQCEDALEQITRDGRDIADFYTRFPNSINQPAPGLAVSLSSWSPEPMSRAWID